MEQKTITLPREVISPTDIARLSRELENLDEFFRQAAIREGGTPQAAPRYSRLLDGVVVSNSMNLLQTDDRERLLVYMKNLAERAPVLHISFSVDPPGAYVQKIVSWLRTNIDGSILVRVGLQPAIGAGCVVRTTNKSFDFSLRRFFDDKKQFFVEKLHDVVSADATPVTSKYTDVAQNIDEDKNASNSDVELSARSVGEQGSSNESDAPEVQDDQEQEEVVHIEENGEDQEHEAENQDDQSEQSTSIKVQSS